MSPPESGSRRGSGTAAGRYALSAGGRAVEAAALMLAAAAAQRWVPVPRWSHILGQPGPVPVQWSGRTGAIGARSGSAVESKVAAAVWRGCRMLPFKPSCLAQATAGQVMLRRRGQPGVVVIGLRPPAATPGFESSADPDRGRWGAHAWLMGSVGALTGGPAAEGFTAINVFRDADGHSNPSWAVAGSAEGAG